MLNKATIPTDVSREGTPRRRRSAPEETPVAADTPSAGVSFRPASERRAETSPDLPSETPSPRPRGSRRGAATEGSAVEPSSETTAPRPRGSRRGAATEGSAVEPSSETTAPRPRRARRAPSARPDATEPASRDLVIPDEASGLGSFPMDRAAVEAAMASRSRRGEEPDFDPWEGFDMNQPPRGRPSYRGTRRDMWEGREGFTTRRPEISQEDRLPETRELEGATRALEGTTRSSGGSTPRSLGVIRDAVLAAKEALARHARSIEPEMLAMVRKKTHPRVWMMGGGQEPHISRLIERAREKMPPREEISDPRVRTAIGHQIMEKLHEDDQVEELMERVYRPLAYTAASGRHLTGRNERGIIGLLDYAVDNSGTYGSEPTRILDTVQRPHIEFSHNPPRNLSESHVDAIEALLQETARQFVRKANSKSKTSSDSDELVNIGGNTSAAVREMLARRQALISGQTTRVR